MRAAIDRNSIGEKLQQVQQFVHLGNKVTEDCPCTLYYRSPTEDRCEQGGIQ